jgi:hypothetical protein
VKDNRFDSWTTAQAHNNNLKDQGIEDKNTNLHPDLPRGEANNEIKEQSRNKENAGRRYKSAGKVLILGLILSTRKSTVTRK